MGSSEKQRSSFLFVAPKRKVKELLMLMAVTKHPLETKVPLGTDTFEP
jgi:hypothetical protein